MGRIKYILFDAANTLIHKPLLLDKMQEVLKVYGYNVPKEKLQIHHKIISEQIDFPDRTNSLFYTQFNAKLLDSLGIYSNNDLLNQIFTACSYLPWVPFEDTSVLQDIPLPMGVLSNFKKNLPVLLNSFWGNLFREVIVSEEENIRKPNPRFFEVAIQQIGLAPDEILYVGDSFRLDYQPAKQMNMNAILIDRMGVYCSCDYIIDDLTHLKNLLK